MSDKTILLAHGGGGYLTHRLLEDLFFPAFDSGELAQRGDGALLDVPSRRLAMTTDSFVVKPLFFPGGDIGKLAVNGTVNDLAMCGAAPRFLTAAFIMEEGLPMASLRRLVASMKQAAQRVSMTIVSGDTKVIDRKSGEGLFITTTGIGSVAAGVELGCSRIREGDVIVASGDIGRHGVAVMNARHGLGFSGCPESDCQPLWRPVSRLIDAGVLLHALRDLTRGGLSQALCEMALAAGRHFAIRECQLPVSDGVRGACELLGLDPMEVACEGRFVAFVEPLDAERTIAILRDGGDQAAVIGSVTPDGEEGTVSMLTPLGVSRAVDMPSGEALPRIC